MAEQISLNLLTKIFSTILLNDIYKYYLKIQNYWIKFRDMADFTKLHPQQKITIKSHLNFIPIITLTLKPTNHYCFKYQQ